MGWLWASSSSAEKAPAPTVVGKESTPPSSTSTHSQSSSSSASDEFADPEIQKFLDLLNEKPKPPKPEDSSQTSSDKPSSSTSSWFTLRSSSSSTASRTAAQVEAPPGNDLSESLIPTEMSCRQAFDQAWACNSMGGQWNAVFRYGEMRSCSEQWDDFWFCMRTKSYSPEMRVKAIQTHYRNKEYAKYGGGKPNSEDIWQSRDEKVEPGSVFKEPIE